MDLSGHKIFREGAFRAGASDRAQENRGQETGPPAPGLSLLAAAWSALASGRVETVSLSLSSGAVIDGVLAIRLDGALAEAATRPGHYTHAFAVADVVMVRQVPRGG